MAHNVGQPCTIFVKAPTFRGDVHCVRLPSHLICTMVHHIWRCMVHVFVNFALDRDATVEGLHNLMKHVGMEAGPVVPQTVLC